MTKILIPVRVGLKHHLKDYKLKKDSKKVTGGIERFAQLIAEFSDVEYVYITKEHREKRQTKSVIAAAINDVLPDIVLSNEISYSCAGYFQEFGIPLISIMHEPLSRNRTILDLGKNLHDIADKGGHIYFVSKNQLNFYDALFKRTFPFDISRIKGFVNPSYCDGDMKPSEEIEWEVSTVGRNDQYKDPFFVHRKFSKTNIKTLVMTGKSNEKYGHENEHWNHTEYGLDHKDILRNISKSSSFISTWPEESWGITAMESLGSGTPIILCTNGTGKHSSETVAASPEHYIKLKKSDSVQDYLDAIGRFKSLTLDQRKEISDRTKEKHSRENFKKQIEDMINLRIEDKNIKRVQNLFSPFN